MGMHLWCTGGLALDLFHLVPEKQAAVHQVGCEIDKPIDKVDFFARAVVDEFAFPVAFSMINRENRSDQAVFDRANENILFFAICAGCLVDIAVVDGIDNLRMEWVNRSLHAINHDALQLDRVVPQLPVYPARTIHLPLLQ